MEISDFAGPSIAVREVPDPIRSRDTPVRIGGKPTMPSTLAWPMDKREGPLHFLFEVDLAALQTQVAQAGRVFDVPRLPQKGKLFVFLQLAGDYVSNGQAEVSVLYAPDSTTTAPETELPEDMPVLDEMADSVCLDLVSDCGRMLAPVSGEIARTFLSHRNGNPFIPIDRPVSDEEQRHWNQVYDAQLKALELERYSSPLDAELDGSSLRIFGFGHDAYDRRIDHSKHVRLFEFGSMSGMQLGGGDIIAQVWIEKTDLANGRFDRTITDLS